MNWGIVDNVIYPYIPVIIPVVIAIVILVRIVIIILWEEYFATG